MVRQWRSLPAVCLKEKVSLSVRGAQSRVRRGAGELNLGYVSTQITRKEVRRLAGHCSVMLERLQAAGVQGAAANRPRRLLERLGFKKIGEGQASFWTNAEGKPVEFTGYSYALTKEEWDEFNTTSLT
jgi:hypothetical protein